MGFEPTISTLGKLHVDPYTKPAGVTALVSILGEDQFVKGRPVRSLQMPLVARHLRLPRNHRTTDAG